MFPAAPSAEMETTKMDEPRYRITEIPISDLKMTIRPRGSIGAQAPRYDRERDEPAFDAV